MTEGWMEEDDVEGNPSNPKHPVIHDFSGLFLMSWTDIHQRFVCSTCSRHEMSLHDAEKCTDGPECGKKIERRWRPSCVDRSFLLSFLIFPLATYFVEEEIWLGTSVSNSEPKYDQWIDLKTVHLTIPPDFMDIMGGLCLAKCWNINPVF